MLMIQLVMLAKLYQTSQIKDERSVFLLLQRKTYVRIQQNFCLKNVYISPKVKNTFMLCCLSRIREIVSKLKVLKKKVQLGFLYLCNADYLLIY